MNDRILKLITEEELEKIKNTKVLLIGLGGVGGYVFEALIRSGMENITIIDKDCYEKTNLNRQVLSDLDSLGMSKVEVSKNHALKINPNILVHALKKNLTPKDITDDFLSSFDYIIDACDDVEVKVELIRKCTAKKKKLISSMGTANRRKSELFEVTTLKKTMGDPLAKKIRTILKKEESSLKTKVVCSKEIPKKQKELGTLAHVPMAAASLITSYVLNDIMNS